MPLKDFIKLIVNFCKKHKAQTIILQSEHKITVLELESQGSTYFYKHQEE